MIDTFCQRAGAELSAVVVYLGVNWLTMGTREFALFNLALVGIWIFVAIRIGRLNKQLVEQKGASEA